MDITETELIWIIGCLLSFGLALGYRSLMSALALMRQQRALGRLLLAGQNDVGRAA